MALAIVTLCFIAFNSLYKVHQLRSFYETMPLRDDLRAHFFFDFPDTVAQAGFIDDTHIAYIKRNDLVICNLRNSLDTKVMHGHSDIICHWTLSPDGKRIVTASQDGTIRLWDAATGAILHISEPLDIEDQPSWTMMTDVRFSKDGKKIYTADMNGIRIWSAKNCRKLKDIASGNFYMRWGLISPDLSSCSAPVIKGGFETMTPEGESIYYSDGGYCPLVYSPDGKYILTAEEDGSNMIGWDIPHLRRKDGIIVQRVLLRDGAPTTCAAYSPDGRELVSASEDGLIFVWNAATGDLRETLQSGEQSICHVSFDPLGSRIIAHGHNSRRVHIWGPRHW